MERVDIAIIGTGPAGVSAAITAKVRNKSVLLIGSRETQREDEQGASDFKLSRAAGSFRSRSGCRVQEAVSRSWHRGDGEARERGLCDGRLFWNPGVRRDS